MDDRVKKELVAAAVPSVVVPTIRAALNHHFAMKQMDRQEEMAVNVAERRNQGIRAMAQQHGGGGAPGGEIYRSDPVSMSPGDVYDELESLRMETDCSFCHNVIDSLMEASPDEARRGHDELRSYLREVERIQNRDISQDQAEELVGDLVDRWEVIPQHVAGMT